MLPKPIILISLLFFASACSPLVPLSYVDGRTPNQLSESIQTDEATVAIRFMQSRHGYIVFDLEITNHSPYDLSVAPQMISFYASSKTFVPVEIEDDVHKISAPNSTLPMTRHFASDPTSIQKFYFERNKSKKVEAGIFALLAVGLILYDQSKDSQDAAKENITSRDITNSIGRDVMVTAAITAGEVAKESAIQAAEESRYLPFELFPECTILPGGKVRGKIFLPRESAHRYVRIVVPLADADYVFDFTKLATKTSQSR